jgi:uncharacterized membrane protein
VAFTCCHPARLIPFGCAVALAAASALSRAGDPWDGAVAALLARPVRSPTVGSAGAWEPVAAKSGLVVVARPIAGSKIREVRAVGVVDQPAERLFAVLGDLDRFPEIMPPTVETHALTKNGDTTLWHIVIDPPLVSKRDYCAKVTLARRADGVFTSTWMQTDEGCPPPSKGVVRMRHTEGRWELTPLDGNRTHVDYLGFSDPGGSIPAWAVNRAAAGSMADMFRSLVKAAADPRYASAR